MNSTTYPKRKRLRTRELSPTGDFEKSRLVIGIAACFCLLGMVFAYGGTQFWASIPFLIPLLILVGMHQSLGLVSFSKGGSPVRIPMGSAVWGVVLLYIVTRAVFRPLVPYQIWTAAYQVGIGLLVYVLFADLGIKRHMRNQIWILVILAGILQAMWAVQLHLKGSNMVLAFPRPENYGMRASGTFICPNHFAHYLQMAGICAVSLFMIPRKSVPMRIISGFALIWMIVGLVLSQSRSGLLGFMVGVGGMLFIKLARRGWKRAVVGFLLAGTAGTALLAAIWFLYPPFSERMLSKDTSQNIRFLEFWPDTWSMIRGEGFWGVGPGVFRHTFDQYREHFSRAWIYLHYAHNEYLHVLAEYGWLFTLTIFGTVAWAVWNWLRQAFTLKDEHAAMIPIMQLGLLGSSLAHAIFDFNLHITANTLVLIMLLGVLQGNAHAAKNWTPRTLSLTQSRWIAACTVAVSVLLLPVSVALFLGSFAEFRMGVAANEQDTESRLEYAAMMRKWTPMHWRGWVEPARANRVLATFNRDPESRSDLIQKSRQDYETALRWNPLDPVAQIGLVELAVLEEDYERALTEIDLLLDLSPYDTAIWIRKGILLQEVERYEESLDVFLHARKLRGPKRDEQVELNIRYLKGKIKKAEPPA